MVRKRKCGVRDGVLAPALAAYSNLCQQVFSNKDALEETAVQALDCKLTSGEKIARWVLSQADVPKASLIHPSKIGQSHEGVGHRLAGV